MSEKKDNSGNKISRIRDKISELTEYLNYLVSITPADFEDYQNDLKTKAACEHYFEKVMEACIDLSFLIIKEKKFEIPDDEESAFNILLKHLVISGNLAKRLISDKGMRNVIAHEYGEVDDIRVYTSLTEEIEKDVDEFIKSVEEYLKLK